MMRRSGRRGLAWAIAGAIVLLVGVAALVIGSLVGNGTTSEVDPTDPSLPTAAAGSIPSPTTSVVDVSAAEQGWIPEPITTDAETYVRAALSAAGTFDTQKSDYEEWITYLGTWFTPDTRYESESDREAELAAAKLEMRQGVVLPETEWDSLANEKGRVSSVARGDVSLSDVPQDASGDMTIGTADVVITYTRADGSGGEVTYEESSRVSVQVLCGPASAPAPNTAQSAGDCKVVRYFTEPLEP